MDTPPKVARHTPERRVTFIGAPFAEGQDLDGCDLAPTAIRDAGLQPALEKLGWDVHDAGDLGLSSSSPRLRAPPPSPPSKDIPNCAHIGAQLKLVHDAVAAAAAAGRVALTVGGDHSIAAASIAALQRAHPNLAVIWVDAHADANTPATSPSMHYHGMPAAHVMGWMAGAPLPGFDWFPSAGCLDEARLAYVGLRDVDDEEGRRLRASQCHVWTMRDVDRLGIAGAIERAVRAVDPHGVRPLHLSLDIDAVDPHFAPGTGTCARGGLTYREAHYICEELALTDRLVGLDLVEVNPLLDGPPAAARMHGDDPSVKPCSPTVELAVGLALSALGKRIM